ncbi:MAG TPA: sugar ABC transporter substrate-binding protein [Vicinamibacterales bacterium]|nr:sugar ABC transporter substrate-binding protein [Vicinamibacterales bacterium]
MAKLIARPAAVALLLMVLAAMTSCGGTSSPARPIVGVSMAHFDDNFLTILRTAMVEHASTYPNIELQFADAQGDVGRQLSEIQNFVAQNAAAIIVNAADTSATPGMTKVAHDAGVPLVYVNRRPAEETLPAGVVFVGSEDLQAGTLEMEELARLMNYRGNVAIMVGELASNGAQLRTTAVENVVAKYPDMKVVEKQVGNFQRERGLDLMNNWLTAGRAIDAVAANNDEMAIGAIMAIRQAGLATGKILVGGVDATPDALAELAKGTLAVTVFQNARGQARGALDAAVKLSRKEQVDSFVWIPFELVTRENYKAFLDR